MVRVTTYAAAFALCTLFPFGAAAAELKVLSPGATESSLSLILPQFESSSEHKVKIEYGPVGQLANRVKTGEAVDVVILSEPVANGLRKGGRGGRRHGNGDRQGRRRRVRAQRRPQTGHQFGPRVPARHHERQADRLCRSQARRLGQHL